MLLGLGLRRLLGLLRLRRLLRLLPWMLIVSAFQRHPERQGRTRIHVKQKRERCIGRVLECDTPHQIRRIGARRRAAPETRRHGALRVPGGRWATHKDKPARPHPLGPEGGGKRTYGGGGAPISSHPD
jgi:hypothetical protein